MSKKNLTKHFPLLTPENYIRQKARNLPIYECLVNAVWKKSRMASVIVSRVHANGNITAGFFLVDLFCLGVKNTTYLFNYPLSKYKEEVAKLVQLETCEITYALAHNIVFAGLDFAAELGLSPHKEFTTLTRFILDEDTDDVELMDVECGRNGKPFYMQGQFDSDQMAKGVIAQLDKAVGEGNYTFALTAEVDEVLSKHNEADFEKVNDENDEFIGMTMEEMHTKFLKLSESLNDMNENGIKTFYNLTSTLFSGFVNIDLIEEFILSYIKDLKIDLLPHETIPFELWGVEPGSMTVTDEMTELFSEIYNLIRTDTKQARKKLKELKIKVGDIPAVRMFGLLILQSEGEINCLDITEDNLEKFPGYPIIQLQKLSAEIYANKDSDKLIMNLLPLKELFKNRASLHEIEFMTYFFTLICLLIKEVNATKIEALLFAIGNIGLPKKIEADVYSYIMTVKYNFVLSYIYKVKQGK